MIETTILETKKGKAAKMKNPVFICGLPGIGLVGKLAAEHIIKEAKGALVAVLYSPSFPHHVIMRKNGTMRMLKNKFYLVKNNGRDILILVGDVQAMTPEAQYEIAGKILDYIQPKGCREIITLGGYGTGKIIPAPRVLGSAISKKFVASYKKYGVIFGETRGAIIGAAGLIPMLARLRGMKAVCLMGETHGAYADPKSAQSIVLILNKILGLNVGIGKLEERAKASERFMKNIEDEAKKQMNYLSKGDDLSYIR
ncbi:proteasome assembly chaperone family protein [Candidatus Micrarchaeota archaeon CG_4_10_14_0_2_um_filter_49_7]|nr:MAG: proteasome assembly chaperone family protein [Candidatus Micrarchaeota archaeon CG_4_10_14_0_2_um_filter_49_7]